MPPDHDRFNGSVNSDDAGSVMRELVSPIPVGLGRIPDRETGAGAKWIFFQLPKFQQLPWLVPAQPRPGSLAFWVRALNAVTVAGGRTVSLVSFTVPQDRCAERFGAPLGGLTADPGTELDFALVPYHQAEQAPGAT